MSFHVICSTADGNQTKEFSNWEDAHTYANEWMDGFTHWNHRHFNNVESTEYVNLWKTRNGEVVKIQEVKLVREMNQNEIENARIEIENCEKCAIARQYADIDETMLCNAHYGAYSEIEGKILVTVDCPNCANQASIAAPGQTVLCKTHSDEKHFKNVFDYLFNAEWNPEYANAAHIKISPSTDTRYPNEIRITAIDRDGEIRSLYACDADLALEPMIVEYEPLEDEIDEVDDSEKICCDIWQQRLQTLREKSVAEINFIDALDTVITRDEYRSLTDEQQRELIQAWLYPTNDDGEIDELFEEIPTDIHYEPNEPNLSENNEVQDLTSIEYFIANVKSYHASVFGVYCSNCFESESTIAVTTNNYTMFEFCKLCYDKLKRAMIARDAKS